MLKTTTTTTTIFWCKQRCIDTQNCIDFAYDNDNLLTQAGKLIITRGSDNGLMTGATTNNG